MGKKDDYIKQLQAQNAELSELVFNTAAERDKALSQLDDSVSIRDQTFRCSHELAEIIRSVQEQGTALQRAHEKALTRLGAFEEIRANSSGVAGYHLNGDIATWEELMDEPAVEELRIEQAV